MTVNKGIPDPSIILIAACTVSVTVIIVAFLGCMWCLNKWKKLTQRHYQISGIRHETPIAPVQNLTEFTIFPPPSSYQFNLPAGISSDEVVFEPLPEIRSRFLGATGEHLRPAQFTESGGKISLQDWFDEYQVNFPRDKLKYVREVGSTWYGQAVEGEAYDIQRNSEKTKVVVKILRVDASSSELMQFLQETRPFRYLHHSNLLALLGHSLEVHPFLLIMEHCEMDLKSFLIEQRKSPESLLKNGTLLQMACCIASALQYMHEHGFIHMNIAAHSCMVSENLVVKLGDYGTAVFIHKEDFYCLSDVAFPIRWCAPETVTCTESFIETKDISREANIWSFGVLVWELFEFGKLPYASMSDDDVIQKVLTQCIVKLEQPMTPCVHKNMLYKIMQLCWLPPTLRPTIQKISTLLTYLYDNRDVLPESTSFESRWNSLQPVIKDHNLNNPPTNVSFRFESDFVPKNDSLKDEGSMMSSDPSVYGDKSPSSGSFSIGYEGELTPDMSPSLLNLRGSIEDLANGNSSHSNCDTNSCTCENLPTFNEISDSGSIQVQITEAIQNLDRILAEEFSNTSSKTTELNSIAYCKENVECQNSVDSTCEMVENLPHHPLKNNTAS